MSVREWLHELKLTVARESSAYREPPLKDDEIEEVVLAILEQHTDEFGYIDVEKVTDFIAIAWRDDRKRILRGRYF